MSERLTSRSPAAAKAVARRKGAVPGAIHFGPGAFHRVHQAWYFDRLMERDSRWAITGVSLKSAGIRDALTPQDGLYVLAELAEKSSFQVIGSIANVIVAAHERENVLELMASPQVGWISATVTEKGYCLDGRGELDVAHADIAHDLANPRTPESLIGYLVEGLRRRRAAGLRPPVIVSCDNLADNGRLLKRAVLQCAAAGDRDLAAWIEGEAAFPRTMVDSITPATNDDLRNLVRAELGVDDAWPVQRERFVQWVIEDCLPAGGPDLGSVGAEITSDVGGYERAKLRLLNGAHSSLAYLGLLRGHETVAGAMKDSELTRFLETMMRDDIAPRVRAPAGFDVQGYVTAVLERFRNPAIRHLLSQIAWDGSKKLPFRLLETIAEARVVGAPVNRLCLPVAAWFEFVRQRAMSGTPIVDPLEAQLIRIGKTFSGDPSRFVAEFLSLREVFQPALAADAVFVEEIARAFAKLASGPQGSLPVG